ncbi:MAG TPA: MAPEG family protein [Rhodanobacteraceae bacterium]|nr:MAPEG family protein [Rhodanobacteraceae bacterium]
MLIAGFYVALGALLILALAARVMWLRNTRRVGLGSGGDADLGRAIRVHANAVEYLPIALLLLVLLAIEQTRPGLLHLFGIVLIVGRILHAVGLSSASGRSFGRLAGIGLTVLVTLAMAILLIVRFAMMHW